MSGTEDPDLPLGSFDSDSPSSSVCQSLKKFNHGDPASEAKAAQTTEAGLEAATATATEPRLIPSLPEPAPALWGSVQDVGVISHTRQNLACDQYYQICVQTSQSLWKRKWRTEREMKDKSDQVRTLSRKFGKE